MSFVYWYVLAAAVLPYVFTGLAKSRRGFDNHAPRAWLASVEGWRARAHAAQLNGFEAFPPFAAGAIIAVQSGADPTWTGFLCAGFLAFRIAHGALYIADLAAWRSVVWTAGFACSAGLYLISV